MAGPLASMCRMTSSESKEDAIVTGLHMLPLSMVLSEIVEELLNSTTLIMKVEESVCKGGLRPLRSWLGSKPLIDQ